jgi:hypothetical protein
LHRGYISDVGHPYLARFTDLEVSVQKVGSNAEPMLGIGGGYTVLFGDLASDTCLPACLQVSLSVQREVWTLFCFQNLTQR